MSLIRDSVACVGERKSVIYQIREFDLKMLLLNKEDIMSASTLSCFIIHSITAWRSWSSVLCAGGQYVHQAKAAPHKWRKRIQRSVLRVPIGFITRCSALEQQTHATSSALAWNKTCLDVMNEQFIAFDLSGVSLGPLNRSVIF